MEAIGDIGGALIGSRSARKAADKQAQAAAAALQFQREQFETTREDQAPYREAGYEALSRLRDFAEPGLSANQVMAEPGYQFGLQQGLDSIQNTAAARGGLYSGNAMKALTRFGNDYATTKFNDAFNRVQTGAGNRWNRLAALAGIGQTATGQTQAAGANFANAAGNIGMSNANAQAASTLSQGQQWGNALNSVISAAGRGGWFGGGGGSVFRADDPYRSPSYFGGDEGE